MNAHPIVLYAEDDENDAFFMQRAFSALQRKETLRIVTNGFEAMEYLRGHGVFADRALHPLPGTVILDIKMPYHSGLEVLQWMRGQPGLRAMPVVMFTSSTQNSDLELSRKHHADAFLTKPSNSTNLRQIAGQIIELASQPSPHSGRVEITGNLL